MLEFKNVSVGLEGSSSSTPFSVVVSGGELVNVCGKHGVGKSRLLKAVMGLIPVKSGFITVDGELVTAGSADYFRQLMAYVPQEMPDVPIKVKELCTMVMTTKAHHGQLCDIRSLMPQWQSLGIDTSLYEANIQILSTSMLQCIMISMLPLMNRPIVLIDDVPQTQEVFTFLRGQASAGAEIVFTSDNEALPCDKLVKL